MALYAFPQQLTALRKARGLRQEDLAALLGMNYRTYRRYETGETEPQLSVLIRLADYFEISLDELVGRPSREKE